MSVTQENTPKLKNTFLVYWLNSTKHVQVNTPASM